MESWKNTFIISIKIIISNSDNVTMSRLFANFPVHTNFISFHTEFFKWSQILMKNYKCSFSLDRFSSIFHSCLFVLSTGAYTLLPLLHACNSMWGVFFLPHAVNASLIPSLPTGNLFYLAHWHHKCFYRGNMVTAGVAGKLGIETHCRLDFTRRKSKKFW